MSSATFDYARRNHTGDRPNGFWDFDREARDIPFFPANFTLLGGYVRGEGHHITPFGFTASPATFGAVGGGSTIVDGRPGARPHIRVPQRRIPGRTRPFQAPPDTGRPGSFCGE